MSALGLTRLVIASDDALFCDGLGQVLSQQPDFIVTPHAIAAGTPIAQLARDHHIILLDARCDRAFGVIPDGALVIIVGAAEDDDWATAMLTAGARGILTRSANRGDLVHAIRTVREGGIWARRRWLNACVMLVVSAFRQRVTAQGAVDARLSRREREVLQHAATGVGNKELADRLSISEATVKVHLTRIFQKLGVPGRAALAAAYHDVGRTTIGVSSQPTEPIENHPFR